MKKQENEDDEAEQRPLVAPVNAVQPAPAVPAQMEWKSCCLSIDARVLQFIAQVSICAFVVVFCMYQLINKPDCPDQQMYMTTLTFVLGVFVPQPRVR